MFEPDILERIANEAEAKRLAQGWLENDEADQKPKADLRNPASVSPRRADL
jgi:hypothetical protein